MKKKPCVSAAPDIDVVLLTTNTAARPQNPCQVVHHQHLQAMKGWVQKFNIAPLL
jgi:hypothetical protein